MGSIIPRRGKRGVTYRAAVCVNGVRQAQSFKSKAEARAWMQQAEEGLSGQRLPEHTAKDAFRRYASEVSPKKRGARFELLRLAALEKGSLGPLRLPALRQSDLAAWREHRLTEVGPASVLREMNLLHSVFKSCVADWGWLAVNPLKGVTRPRPPPSRKRRISEAEVAAVCVGLGYAGGSPVTASQRVAVAFLFALETAMRSGEIVGLRWRDVGPHAVTLPQTKNGDAREVALSSMARQLLALLPQDRATVFDLKGPQRDALFRKGRDKAGLTFTFHDSRAEAIWRLSKKLDVMELARMIGHRDLKSLLLYYATSAAELSAKLG